MRELCRWALQVSLKTTVALFLWVPCSCQVRLYRAWAHPSQKTEKKWGWLLLGWISNKASKHSHFVSLIATQMWRRSFPTWKLGGDAHPLKEAVWLMAVPLGRALLGQASATSSEMNEEEETKFWNQFWTQYEFSCSLMREKFSLKFWYFRVFSFSVTAFQEKCLFPTLCDFSSGILLFHWEKVLIANSESPLIYHSHQAVLAGMPALTGSLDWYSHQCFTSMHAGEYISRGRRYKLCNTAELYWFLSSPALHSSCAESPVLTQTLYCTHMQLCSCLF